MKKTAVIYGMGAIGEAVALALNEADMNLVLLDRDIAAAKKVLSSLPDHRHAVAFSCVPLDTSSIETVITKAENLFGGINALFNGNLHMQRKKAREVTDTSFTSSFQSNVLAYFHLARTCAAVMAKSGGGRIVNLSSVHSEVADGLHLEYAAASAAINAMTRELAVSYWKDNIQVNGVMTAFVDGQFPDALDMDQRQKPEQISLLGRRITPEDIARTVRFLMTSHTKIINGSVLRADAGYLTTQYRVGDTPFTKITG